MQHLHFSILSDWFSRRWRRWRGLPDSDDRHLPRFCRPRAQWPTFVGDCPQTMTLVNRLRLLDWERLPPAAPRHWFGQPPVPVSAYIGAFLVKLELQLATTAQLHRFLLTHPPLVWALGFPLPVADNRYGFDVRAALPTARHFNRVLRELPNDLLQQLLDAQVAWLVQQIGPSFGQVISLDTKHIIAWVKENNPKAYIKEGRFAKTQQPTADPDCKLGCKRRRNLKSASADPALRTPTAEGLPASGLPVSVGEFYWGYASGIVATKLPGLGEFVLAELTQPFDQADVTYFFPLMHQVEQRLGRRPRFGALDAAYDAFYVYDFFHSADHDGFAAVPFSEKGGKGTRQFDAEGLPLCAAGLSMPVKQLYKDTTTTLIPHRRARHVCPLRFPQPNGQTCPIDHPRWPKGGCSAQLPVAPGARIRHQLDRESDRFKQIYKQRTAVERINSQATALGIDGPGCAIGRRSPTATR